MCDIYFLESQPFRFGCNSLLGAVMLNYAGEYGEYCDARQAAVTVIRSSDAALKSCLEWLTMNYIISDSAYLISV